MPRDCEAVILTYHSISDGPVPLCISPRIFAAQMSWLNANTNVVSLRELVEYLAGGRPLPPRTVALTFDDGFSDFHAAAAPTLKRLDLPVTVFLPAAYCGRDASWDSPVARRSLMTWTQIRELTSQGVHFGSHSLTHPVLTKLTDAELIGEIVESKRWIEAETGQEVRFFCYPYGCLGARICEVVKAHYSGGACSTVLSALSTPCNRFALPRLDVHYLRNPAIFKLMFTARFREYIRARRAVRNLRLRLRPTNRKRLR